jgi:4'-phosphopantetheinyl transferase
LKTVASAYLRESDWHELKLRKGVFGQPFMIGHHLEIPGLTLAHSQSMIAAMAFPVGHPVGIDVEKLDEVNALKLRLQLTSYELEVIQSKGMDSFQTIIQFWSMKEALTKAILTGLSVPLDLLGMTEIVWHSPTKIEARFTNFKQYKVISGLIGDHAISIAIPFKTQLLNLPF